MSSSCIPPSAPSLSALTRAVRRQTVTVQARLRSILDDANWLLRALAESASCGALPVFANTRAGDWYVPRERVTGSCCFKSHDGHRGTIGFSVTRLNLALAACAARRGGAIVVDATSGSKRFPDSCVTVAVWASVINAVRGTDSVEGASLRDFFPSWLPRGTFEDASRAAVSAAAELPDALADLIRAELNDLGGRALVPTFVCQPSSTLSGNPGSWEETVWPLLDPNDGTVPIVFVSVSRFVDDTGDVSSAQAGWHYIPGAGDDHENWAGADGLTPALFWSHWKELTDSALDDESCCEAVRKIVSEAVVPKRRCIDANAARRLFRASTAIRVSPGAVQVHVATSAVQEVMWSCSDEDQPAVAALDPGTIMIVETVARGDPSSTFPGDAPNVVRVYVPTDKRSTARSRDLWGSRILPVISAAVESGGSILVAFEEPGAAPAAAAIAAVALLSGGAINPQSKIDVRVALSLASVACVAPCVEKATVKTLMRIFLPP